MKTKRKTLFGMLAIFMLVVGFVLPANLVSPSATKADPGVCKWDYLVTPLVPNRNDIVGCSELHDMVVGNDDKTIVVTARTTSTRLYYSSNDGRSFSGSKWNALTREPQWPAGAQVYSVAVAPDNPKFYAVTTDVASAIKGGPREVWVTQDAGANWDLTNLNLPSGETIRCIDISVDYGGKRDIAVGTVTGTGGGRLLVVKSTGFSGWQDQLAAASLGTAIDFFAVKFSPSYTSDAALVVAFANATSTFYNVSLHDIDQNTTTSWAFNTPGIEVKDPSWVAGSSPGLATLRKADLELPSDFSGQAASLRRAYISLDTFGASDKATTDRDGIFRVDDSTVYTLMDTSNVVDKSIYSIAYFGTYASGKLLAGEHMGYPCTATVPTWFTDSPTTCPIPCWYPALKPTTGAACQGACTVGTKDGIGAAIVAWNAKGTLGFVITGSQAVTTRADWFKSWLAVSVCNDESAFAISRNNGETWNQLALIDTTITRFTDIAPTPDCKTIYLASVNDECAASPGDCWAKFHVSCNVSSGGGPFHGTVTVVNGEVTGTSYPPSTKCKITYVNHSANCTCDITPDMDLDFDGDYYPDECACKYTITGTITYQCECSPFCDNECVVNDAFTESCPFEGDVTRHFCDCACPCCANECDNCCGFDSVWRSSSNADVVSPLPANPIGDYWERVFTHVTAADCAKDQTNVALLRTVPYCADPSGEILGWAAYGAPVAFWSPDFGDYWAPITVRNKVQDFAFESRTMLYFLSPTGLVQKMPFTGTAFSTSLPSYDSSVNPAHTIVAQPEGKILVGKGADYSYAAAYSFNMNTDNPTFGNFLTAGPLLGGNVHVAFDTNFDDTSMIYIAVEDAGGSVYRNNPVAQLRWSDTDLMAASNGAFGSTNPDANRDGFTGIVLAFTDTALYASSQVPGMGVWRSIDDGGYNYGPLSGLPKPGIAWDDLTVGLPSDVEFTAQPTALKLCGCCTLDTDTTLYAIDDANYNVTNKTGLVWAFTDCLAKRGPSLITEDKALIGCDPISGRAGEVNLCWEQLCVANEYSIAIAKDPGMTLMVVYWTDLAPSVVTAPCAFFPAGGYTTGWSSAIAVAGNLECGHTYYWAVKASRCATGQAIRSKWSEERSFSVKAGLPVVSSYTGLQLLSPANGGMGIPVKSPSFSWAPLGENTKYKFQLAKDSAMTQIVKEAEVTNTAYAYDGTLDYSTPYFWKVSCVDPACDASATFSFQTEPKPAGPEQAPPPAPTPIWVWVVIAIGAILVIVTLVLIFKTRRV